MNKLSNFQGKSQYANDIISDYRSSACGPVTAYTMMRHIIPDMSPFTVNGLYEDLGCTKVGLTKRRFIQNLRKLLGSEWIVEECGIEEVKREIVEGRPVAAKFDKWTSLRWWGTYEFDYHWVPVIGFEEVEDKLFLLVHDNGSLNRDSRIRRICFISNEPILSFVKVKKSKR